MNDDPATTDLADELANGNLSHLRFAPRALLRLEDARTGARNCPTLGCVTLRYQRAAVRQRLEVTLRDLLTNREAVRALQERSQERSEERRKGRSDAANGG